MKTQNKNVAANLEKTEVNAMFHEVKETVAANLNTATHKSILSSADLWNIQRMSKTRTGRRFFI